MERYWTIQYKKLPSEKVLDLELPIKAVSKDKAIEMASFALVVNHYGDPMVKGITVVNCEEVV